MTGELPPFPGAVGLTGLDAYPWPTVDGAHGGSPHMHLTCGECYVVISGRGRLQTLDAHGHKMTELSPGDVVWFGPGTIHRAINDGDLRVVIVMQNSGLPESGDAVMTFPPEHLTTPERYAEAATLTGADDTDRAARARERRDLAVEGMAELVRQWDSGKHAAYVDFCAAAARLVRPRLDAWARTVEDGALAEARKSLEHIDALRRGDIGHLSDAAVHRIARPGGQTLGMCGFLHAYDPVRRAGASAGGAPRSGARDVVT
ncbi:cupin domain-containing protein [Streptomyces sp. NPDC057376]|uniref:cupin domain-containing protein n=1 Tax=unclassified Streptomyces TaxID=2593676 RepID=UPI000939341D|nr:cupin domain-containing protein [Streptomyces sp. CB02414]